jgi:hypothetical protein
MAEKPAEPKVYFNCLPKEQVFAFFEAFKKAFDEIPKSEEKKNIDFEIKGTNEELKGMCFETHRLEKSKFKEMFDSAQGHIQKALLIASITINAKNDDSVKILQENFEKLKQLFFPNIPFVKKHPENYELNLRTDGTKLTVDFTSVKGEFLEPLIKLGIDPSEYHKIDAYLRSGFSPEDFFNLPIEEMTLKAIQFALSFKSESIGVRRLLTAAIQALKGIKLSNDKFQKKLEDHIDQLNVLNAFVSFAFNFEFDAKELHGQGLKAASETILKGVDINKKLDEARNGLIAFLKGILKGLIEQFQLTDAVKAVNLDDICIAVGCPQYEAGLIHTIHLPGFTQTFVSKIFE